MRGNRTLADKHHLVYYQFTHIQNSHRYGRAEEPKDGIDDGKGSVGLPDQLKKLGEITKR
jgi:hypothetical protein